MQIRKYQESDFSTLCEIHDPARKQELAAANLTAAFIPFKVASQKRDYLTIIKYMLLKKIRLQWVL